MFGRKRKNQVHQIQQQSPVNNISARPVGYMNTSHMNPRIDSYRSLDKAVVVHGSRLFNTDVTLTLGFFFNVIGNVIFIPLLGRYITPWLIAVITFAFLKYFGYRVFYKVYTDRIEVFGGLSSRKSGVISLASSYITRVALCKWVAQQGDSSYVISGDRLPAAEQRKLIDALSVFECEVTVE